MFDSKLFLSTLTSRPGVYRMIDSKGEVLYVGKAKNLKNRVSSYFREQSNSRIRALVKRIDKMEVTVTRNEKEALLLENELIKSLKPKFNVVLRDDKSYPYLFLSKSPFPRLVFHRGPLKEKGEMFGPYPSAYAVKETLSLLQRLFKIRQCDDVFFKNRSRPCLQYQINRCTAPCCNYVTEEAYATDVSHARLFLKGEHQAVLEALIKDMQEASTEMAFEKAALIRDKIANLQKIIETQLVYGKANDFDIISIEISGNQAVFYILFIRQGKMCGGKSYNQDLKLDKAEVMRGFIAQYYLNQPKMSWPQEIIINEEVSEKALLEQTLSEMAGRKIKITTSSRGDKRQWLDLSKENARLALRQRLRSASVYYKRLTSLQEVLGQDVRRMECFDISHTFGEATVASCVVFNEQGPDKASYRQYNIEDGHSDDYAAMRQVLLRRYLNAKTENLPLPDVLIVDGGKGQLNIAREVLKECQIIDVLLMGVAKGEGRKPGLETIFVATEDDKVGIVKLPPMSEALHLIQQIRDESHRFAIMKHRAKRAKARRSQLQSIPGIGVKRRTQLLNHFGGLKELTSASEQAIGSVPGISKKLAKVIYDHLHSQ